MAWPPARGRPAVAKASLQGGGQLRPGPLQGAVARRAAAARRHDRLRARRQQEGRLWAEAPPAANGQPDASGQPARCCLPATRPQRHGAGRRGGCRQATAAATCVEATTATAQKGNIELGHPLVKG
ncbi:hypothetical protein BHM03_00035927 [Ensete ventricosum]|nr:hypothetical protein BHM03_00035927 [Ensete ventricosum]